MKKHNPASFIAYTLLLIKNFLTMSTENPPIATREIRVALLHHPSNIPQIHLTTLLVQHTCYEQIHEHICTLELLKYLKTSTHLHCANSIHHPNFTH
jgi:hypothetical protein